MSKIAIFFIPFFFFYADYNKQNRINHGNANLKHSSKSKNMNIRAYNSKKTSYLALGDSYTIGESVSESDRWPVLLTELLNKKGYDISAPKIIAKTGWTTDELKAAIEKEAIKDTFDIVSLSIGVNNQYRGREVENFRREFAELLQMAINFAGNKAENVFVLSIPDWGKTPFAKGRDQNKIEHEIEKYNQVKKEECKKSGVAFIDITKLTQNIGNDSALLAKDGLHYSGRMHQLWVNEILKNRNW